MNLPRSSLSLYICVHFHSFFLEIFALSSSIARPIGVDSDAKFDILWIKTAGKIGLFVYKNSLHHSFLKIYDAVYNTHPDFTFCVQYSFILWSPCLLFWLIFPFWVFKVTKRQPNKIKLLSWLIILKTVCLYLCLNLDHKILSFIDRNSWPCSYWDSSFGESGS